MRTFSRRPARFVFAAVSGIVFAVLGAGTAHAEGSTSSEQATTVSVDSTPSTAGSAAKSGHAASVSVENFPWG